MSLSPRMFDDVGRSIKSRRLRALALGALAAVILLLIASTSFVAYLAASAPVVATYWRPITHRSDGARRTGSERNGRFHPAC